MKALTSEILQLKAVVAVLHKGQKPSLEESTPTSDSQANEVLDVNNPTAEGKLPWNIVVRAKKGGKGKGKGPAGNKEYHLRDHLAMVQSALNALRTAICQGSK